MSNSKDPNETAKEQLPETDGTLNEKAREKGSREYKSRLFSFIFGRDENKAWTLSLYNALHGSSYTDPADIVINTMEDVVYMGMKNDLSILVSSSASLYSAMGIYEQQSTFNPNIPIREFMYAGKLYDKYLHAHRLNRYGTKLVPLPIPKLVCLYNGKKDAADETVLALADAFKEEIRQNLTRLNEENGRKMSPEQTKEEVDRIFAEADPDILVKVRMVNINYGRSSAILDNCAPLNEYAWFVNQVRRNESASKDGLASSLEEAIDKAINEMPDGFVIKKFITANRAEVKDMCLTEYDETETMELFREEGREEGRKEGREEGRREDILVLMQKLNITVSEALELLDIPKEKQDLFASMTQ